MLAQLAFSISTHQKMFLMPERLCRFGWWRDRRSQQQNGLSSSRLQICIPLLSHPTDAGWWILCLVAHACIQSEPRKRKFEWIAWAAVGAPQQYSRLRTVHSQITAINYKRNAANVNKWRKMKSNLWTLFSVSCLIFFLLNIIITCHFVLSSCALL